MLSCRLSRWPALALFLLGAARVGAVVTADGVVSYTGTDPSATAALGLPSLSNPDFVDPVFGTFPGGVVTPFNAPYDPSQLVSLSVNQVLTLHLSATVPTTGQTLGVHAGVGLGDYDYPNGQTSTLNTANPAKTPPLYYTNPRSAKVEVSETGNANDWVSLGDIQFTVPTNAYSMGVTTPGLQADPGTQEADFGKPFLGTGTDFYSKNWDQVQTLLNGSGGGTWLDLSQTGLLSGVNFIRFTGDDADNPFFLDAITAVPEPGSAVILMVLGGNVLLRRRRRLEVA